MEISEKKADTLSHGTHHDREMMKASVYYNNSDVRLEDRPIPSIGTGEMLVKIEACGLCGGDTMEWYMKRKAPVVLGHEPAGTVVEIGPEVEKFKVGDRVFVHHHVPCFSCHYCRRGSFTMCEHFPKTNIYPRAFAEFIRVPAENVQHDTHLLPDHMSFEEGTLVEPMACVVKGIKLAGIQPGDTVAVIGSGLMGLGFTQLARVWGAAKVVAFDLSDRRLSKALELGADHSINPTEVDDPLEALKELNEGRGADSVIVTPNGVRAYQLGLSLAGKGATVHLFSPSEPDATITLSPNDLFFRELTLTTTYSCTHIDTVQALKFLANGQIDGKAMITHRWGLHQGSEAISTFLQAEDSIKSVIIPDLTPGVGET